MDQVSRPLLAVLVATVAFLALWLVALKPSSSTTTGKSEGLGVYQSAINRAHQAVATANSASAAEGGKAATTPAVGATARSQPAPGTRAAQSAAASAGSAAARAASQPPSVKATSSSPTVLARALSAGKVLALLFYNPPATDDRAVKRELASVPTHGGRVLKVALPLNDLSRYSVVTDQVPVMVSPTLVLINRNHQASTITGFADRFEISQRVADALG